MSKVYMYVVDRDFGFAPNPFHGVCSLATCKPRIRGKALTGDWIVGMGGDRMNLTGQCIFAMKVSKTLSFNEYWSKPEFLDKKPVRNGSSRMMVGDNIYFRNPATTTWHQADSHHSNPDGSVNRHNLENDTQTDRVLLSDYFYYFGTDAPVVPQNILRSIGFKNGIGHRVFPQDKCSALIGWLNDEFAHVLNLVNSDPYYFNISEKRYSLRGNKIF
jgi:hypothetical protein